MSVLRGIGLSVLTAGAASAVINTALSLAAQALGADPARIGGLAPPAFILFAIIGLLIAALVWSAVRGRCGDAADPGPS